MAKIKPTQDRQTVTPQGESIKKRIEGLVIRSARVQVDRRGELSEIYNPEWGLHPDPMVYAYMATLRPKAIKGWVVHRQQDDRIFICSGVLRWVFYDDRKDSLTYKMINDFTFSDRNRALIIIPKGVFHAVQNVGETEGLFVNLPTQPYNHADPDKFRLPKKNDLIPFDFDDPNAW
jgi:dTDP-4-dehydrorhamnose 3,5-epimerase